MKLITSYDENNFGSKISNFKSGVDSNVALIDIEGEFRSNDLMES